MEPQAKRRPGREISFSELQSLSYAIAHFPPCTPNRWELISEYVKSMANSRDSVLYDISGSGKRFDCSHTDCQFIARLLGSDIPDVGDFLDPFFRGSDTKGFMSVILLPPVSQCCGSNLLIPIVACTLHMVLTLLRCSLVNAKATVVQRSITTAKW